MMTTLVCRPCRGEYQRHSDEVRAKLKYCHRLMQAQKKVCQTVPTQNKGALRNILTNPGEITV